MFKLSLLSLSLAGVLWPLTAAHSIDAAPGINGGPPVLLPDKTLESGYVGARMRSVAVGDINGDGYDDLIGGAPFLSDGDLDTEDSAEGAIFVYLGGPTGLSSNPSRVIQSNMDVFHDGTRMGFSVASGGDVNGDGYDDVLVGVPRYGNQVDAQAGIFVYFGGPGNLDPTPDAILEWKQISFMGRDIAIAGDVNADGFDDVIVGSPNHTHGETNEGAALIYFGGPGAFDTSADAILDTNVAYKQVHSVAAAGDIDGDGYDDVLVGSSRMDNGQTNEGFVWLYYGGPGAFDSTVDQQFESNWAGAMFGLEESLAGSGDLNGDGRPDLVFGAPVFSNIAAYEGAFSVFLSQEGGIDSVPELRVEGGAEQELLGAAVHILGDIDHDGFDDLGVNVEGLDAVGIDEGGTYIYRGGPGGVSPTPDLVVRSGVPGIAAGSHLASGDFNGDGEIDIAFGAPSFAKDEAGEGAVFIKYGPLLGNDRIFADGFELLP